MNGSITGKIVAGFPVTPRERSVLAFMGYPWGPGKSPFIESRLALIRELKACYGNLVLPRGVFGWFRFRAGNGGLVLEESGALLKSEFLLKKFGEEGTIGLFVVTIGGALEEKAAELMKENRALESLTLDALASESVEQAAWYLHRFAQKELARRLIRYSPGFDEHRGKNDWKLTDQKVIFSLLQPERIGVHLSGSCMMIPRKSVSAIVGERCEKP